MTVLTKRIYATADGSDGFRVLVDRLWPRGISTARANIDVWLKDVAPSHELRTWFHHEPQLWDEFRERYLVELADNPAVDELRAIAKDHDPVTLLFGAKDEERNQAIVLAEFLR